MKKEWYKPQLVVITRSQPEVSMLILCKYYELGGPDLTGCYSSVMRSDTVNIGLCYSEVIS